MFQGAVTNFAHFPSTGYTTVVTSGAANVKGVYSAPLSSSLFTATGTIIHILATTAGNRVGLVDLARGAAGAEIVIIPNYYIAVGGWTDACNCLVDCPIALAIGTRVSIRWQCSVTTIGLYTSCYIYASDGLYSTFTGISTYGSNTATSIGVIVDPGGVLDTKGTYMQLTASTSAATRAVSVRPRQSNNAPQSFSWLMDISTGAGGAETVVLSDLYLLASLDEMFWPEKFDFGLAIPASTRISARAQCNGIDATDRLFFLNILGYEGTVAVGSGSSDSAFVSMQ